MEGDQGELQRGLRAAIVGMGLSSNTSLTNTTHKHKQTKQTQTKALTKEINRHNESRISGRATQTGGTLAVVGKKAPPPVLAPASTKIKKSGRNAPEEKPDLEMMAAPQP